VEGDHAEGGEPESCSIGRVYGVVGDDIDDDILLVRGVSREDTVIEVQIRRACRESGKPSQKGFLGLPIPVGGWFCNDCGVWASTIEKLEHKPVVEWVSLAEAMRLTHIEEGGKE
jgi:hypothetical protein